MKKSALIKPFYFVVFIGSVFVVFNLTTAIILSVLFCAFIIWMYYAIKNARR